MKIRNKVLIIVVISLILSIIGIYTIAEFQVLGNIKSQEKKIMMANMSNAEYLVNNSIDELNTISSDWAPWDDTLEFIRTGNSKYIESNLNSSSFNNLRVNTFIILDKNNKIRYAEFYDLENKQFVSMPQDLLNYINDEKAMILNHKDVHSVISGIINVNGKVMMVSSRPITDSQYKAPIEGTFIIGRYIDVDFINKINNIVNSNVEIEKISNIKNVRGGIEVEVNHNKVIFSNKYDKIIQPIDKNKLFGYSIIKGVEDEQLFILQLESGRGIFSSGTKSVKFLIFLFIICSSLFFGLCMKLLKIFVVIPIENISNEVSNINLIDSEVSRIKIVGNDEVSKLAVEINNMLKKIQLDNKKIIDSEKQLKLVLEGANVGFWDWDIEKDNLEVNEKFLSILGYTKNELPHSSELWDKLIHKEDFEYSSNFLKNSLWRTLDINVMEQRLLSKSGEYKWVLNQSKVVEYNKDDSPKRMTGIVTDITDKKKHEKELKYLTYYDKLTGTFNRGYYEFMLDKINENGRLPLTIIMGDLNGLKITNDTFGHEEGDMLLKETAEVLKAVCGSNAIISRYGGDEFIILLENRDEVEADKICMEIKRECLKKKVGSIWINIALGHATKFYRYESIDKIIKRAEDRMYRNKLLEDRSTRNSIISSLSKTLSEKSYETEEHAQRIYSYCSRICELLNLDSNKTDELYLLAKLHDIGKIAIEDKILNKPDKLNDDEWKVMKTHSEIGYRIASSTPDLRHIAYYILTHHEKYDGTGYPKGLKGEEIPLLSRLLAIVDAFDVMTHDRPYRKAISVEEAIKELKRCAGTQFDPNLVEICIQAFKRKN